MKYWHFVATVFLLEASTSPLLAGSPVMPAKSASLPAYQEKGGRDVSQNAWSSWDAPVSTVDPSQLVSSDSADLTASNGVSGLHLSSQKAGLFQFASAFNEAKPVHVEKSKPIQEIEPGNTTAADIQPAAATVVVAPKSGSNHILLIAVISVAVLAYRKFRRTNAGPYPRKPSFL